MPKKSKKKKNFSFYARYGLLIIILLGVFLIGYLSYHFVLELEENKLNNSYLVKHNLVAKSFKIENDLSELNHLNKKHFVYVSYTGTKEIYSMEKNLATLIKKYKLKDNFYYVTIDSIKESANRVNLANDFLGLTEVKLEKVPTIYYVNENNEIKQGYIITRLDDNLIEQGDFQQLLDILEY